MSRISMDETSGCLSWLAAYCLGSYLFLGIVVQTLDPRLLVVAPLVRAMGNPAGRQLCHMARMVAVGRFLVAVDRQLPGLDPRLAI